MLKEKIAHLRSLRKSRSTEFCVEDRQVISTRGEGGALGTLENNRRRRWGEGPTKYGREGNAYSKRAVQHQSLGHVVHSCVSRYIGTHAVVVRSALFISFVLQSVVT